MICLRLCLLALVATLANADIQGFLAKSNSPVAHPSDGPKESVETSEKTKSASGASSSLVQMQSDHVDPESDLALYSKQIQKRSEGAGFIQLQQAVDSRLSRRLNSAILDDSRFQKAFVQTQSDLIDPESDVGLYGKQVESGVESGSASGSDQMGASFIQDGIGQNTKPTPVSPSSLFQTQSEDMDAESDMALYGRSMDDVRRYGKQAVETAAGDHEQPFAAVEDSARPVLDGDSVTPKSFAQVQSDYVDHGSGTASDDNEAKWKLVREAESLIQVADALIKEHNATKAARRELNAARESALIQEKVKRFIQGHHSQLDDTSPKDVVKHPLSPEAFAKVQADYALLESGIDPESDFVIGMQTQGKVPVQAQVFAQGLNASQAMGNELKALDTQTSSLAKGVEAEDMQSGVAATAEIVAPPSGIAPDSSTEYTDSEVALENGPSAGDVKPTLAPQELQKAASFFQLQNEAAPMMEPDPASDLALYSEVYQNGSFDL